MTELLTSDWPPPAPDSARNWPFVTAHWAYATLVKPCAAFPLAASESLADT